MVSPFEAEYRENRAFLEATDGRYGQGIGYIEAQCLHGVLRSLKPARVVEVGSGVSTHCATNAINLNAQEGRPGWDKFIEPFPSQYIRQSNTIRLIRKKVQGVNFEVFDQLQSSDLLFINSSHTVKPGGDVPFIYLHILPRLRSGVVIHIHDIFLPYLYQPDLLDTLYQWSETAFLAAFLTYNSRIQILFCLSMLHHDAPNLLKTVFPAFQPAQHNHGLADRSVHGHRPSSIYLSVT